MCALRFLFIPSLNLRTLHNKPFCRLRAWQWRLSDDRMRFVYSVTTYALPALGTKMAAIRHVTRLIQSRRSARRQADFKGCPHFPCTTLTGGVCGLVTVCVCLHVPGEIKTRTLRCYEYIQSFLMFTSSMLFICNPIQIHQPKKTICQFEDYCLKITTVRVPHRKTFKITVMTSIIS